MFFCFFSPPGILWVALQYDHAIIHSRSFKPFKCDKMQKRICSLCSLTWNACTESCFTDSVSLILMMYMWWSPHSLASFNWNNTFIDKYCTVIPACLLIHLFILHSNNIYLMWSIFFYSSGSFLCPGKECTFYEHNTCNSWHMLHFFCLWHNLLNGFPYLAFSDQVSGIPCVVC